LSDKYLLKEWGENQKKKCTNLEPEAFLFSVQCEILSTGRQHMTLGKVSPSQISKAHFNETN
jgi:hypothetical protein